MENTEIEKLKYFIESKEHYKDDLLDILYFGRKFELTRPGFLEVYPSEFIKNKKDFSDYTNYGKMTIVGGEIGSQGRYGVDFISNDSRNNAFLYKVGIHEFIKMTLAGKIILIGE